MPKQTEIDEEFSRIVSVRKIPAAGLEVTLTATPEECAALAERLGILACETLSAELRLTAADSDGRRVKAEGRLAARAVQACVVSLEPVAQEIDEEISLLFLDESLIVREETQVFVDADPDDDVPFPIVDGSLDAGAAVAECLALVLDPYPRKAGAGLPPEPPEAAETGGEARRNPFAALAALRGAGDAEADGNET
ncbi:YceD family protein [Oleispirillum naphthae]|uniref:YceD family protein n=1 Tax=Oleispirillum naphthae TaxID=2838853 RepID=UPI00308245B6